MPSSQDKQRIETRKGYSFQVLEFNYWDAVFLVLDFIKLRLRLPIRCPFRARYSARENQPPPPPPGRMRVSASRGPRWGSLPGRPPRSSYHWPGPPTSPPSPCTTDTFPATPEHTRREKASQFSHGRERAAGPGSDLWLCPSAPPADFVWAPPKTRGFREEFEQTGEGADLPNSSGL